MQVRKKKSRLLHSARAIVCITFWSDAVCQRHKLAVLLKIAVKMKCVTNSSKINILSKRFFSMKKPEFGILFDIDGVIARGRNVIPAAKTAFNLLRDKENLLKVPVAFVTNAGNCLRSRKAEQLSKWLQLKVVEDQVVMSHSPLKLFKEYHNKNILLSGQGPVREIAKNLGFKKCSTIEDVRLALPLLDEVDLERRNVKEIMEQKLEPIEAIVLLGESVRWETSLQLLMDALLTQGFKEMPPRELHYPHIPLLACNMDLQWMSEASMPRFGHGAFLLCLEELYRKICGVPLQYTSAVGKPSEITFHHAFCLLMAQARKFHSYPQRVYAVGDNIFTDIYGGNLYDQYLNKGNRKSHSTASAKALEKLILSNSSMNHYPDTCITILVETGVYSQENNKNLSHLGHHPRDFSPTADELVPRLICKDIDEAVRAILNMEQF